MSERYYDLQVNNISPRRANVNAAQKRNPNAAAKRRNAVETNARRRKRRRKRSNFLYFVILMLFVAIALVTLSVTVLFNISKIEVSGAQEVLQSDIIEASGVSEGENLFRLNIENIQNNILNKLDSLDNVTVSRKLPSTLSISVQETQAEYNLKQDDSTYMILSKNFRVMKTGEESPEGSAVVLTGISVQNATKGDFVDLNSADGYEETAQILSELSEQDIENIKEIDVSNTMNISINCNNKYKILIGTVSGIAYKLQFAKEVMTNNLNSSDKGVIDVRQEGQLSFRPDDDVYETSSAKKATSSSSKKSGASSKSNKNSASSSDSSN